MTEETEGLKSCVVTLHNLIHLSEDIERFGSPDNFWCYTFERAVKGYTQRLSNAKNLELTFARAECRKEFLRFRCMNKESIDETDNLDEIFPFVSVSICT